VAHPQASLKLDKVLLTCPHCGHRQPEPPSAYSTNCKKCFQYFRVQGALHPVPKVAEARKDQRQITCFKCGAGLSVPPAAQSTMCKGCSSHVDLRDYQIANAASKNFKTKGRFVIEESGFLFNTDSVVGEAVLKGRLLGKLTAERSLEIHTSAEIKGSFKTACLIIPVGNRFRWPETIELVEAEIAGELVGRLQAQGTVRLKSTARFFGDVQAGGLVVEEGAVFVGAARIGV
jgi:cytoskeletal protein CcmA (bactofilin family)